MIMELIGLARAVFLHMGCGLRLWTCDDVTGGEGGFQKLNPWTTYRMRAGIAGERRSSAGDLFENICTGVFDFCGLDGTRASFVLWW